jgi:hypothetical protein
VLLLLFSNFTTVIIVCLNTNIKHGLDTQGVPLREITLVIIFGTSKKKIIFLIYGTIFGLVVKCTNKLRKPCFVCVSNVPPLLYFVI